jgi:formate dehydrogenase subunit gamma
LRCRHYEPSFAICNGLAVDIRGLWWQSVAVTKSDRIAEIVDAHAHRAGPLLPILHDIQAEFGCIDRKSEAAVALALNLSRAEVHGVVSFYHDFTPTPDPRPVVQLCRAEACQARGVEALVPAAERAAGERVRLTTVYCLGLCGVGPNARIGDRLVARLDVARLVGEIDRA